MECRSRGLLQLDFTCGNNLVYSDLKSPGIRRRRRSTGRASQTCIYSRDVRDVPKLFPSPQPRARKCA